MSVPILISNIRTLRIKNTKGADKFPEGKTDLVLMKNVQHIIEPGQKYGMGSFIPASAFATMNPYNALFCEFDPWLIIIFQYGTVKIPVSHLSRPLGFG